MVSGTISILCIFPHNSGGVMRGLSLNSAVVQHSTSSFERQNALELLSRNGKSRRLSAVSFSNRRVTHNIVFRQRLSLGSTKFDPLCIEKELPQWFSDRRIAICRAYGSPPDVPVREDQELQEHGEADAEESDEEKTESVVSETSETVPPDVANTITSWGTLPPRVKLIVTTAFAFVICNMDKVSGYFLPRSKIILVLLLGKVFCHECLNSLENGVNCLSDAVIEL